MRAPAGPSVWEEKPLAVKGLQVHGHTATVDLTDVSPSQTRGARSCAFCITKKRTKNQRGIFVWPLSFLGSNYSFFARSWVFGPCKAMTQPGLSDIVPKVLGMAGRLQDRAAWCAWHAVRQDMHGNEKFLFCHRRR